ncbi:MAG: hypothetical protein Q8938_13320 [Bacteroidota bacterium]|nr:hypothetical protein [Bacteroidota bacterium]MDP4254984.1 hypothetical protein [Bacteroidota bacterium]MDP4258640.1 hypothetical protein [Bacteroidota bacterium]
MKKGRINSPTILCLVSVACLASATCLAQSPPQSSFPPDSFAYWSALDTVRQAGFYRITLTPELVAKCREDLSDLRIADKDGKFMPYVLRSDLPVFTAENFIDFPILSNEKLKDSSTEIVIANRSTAGLDHLLLIIKNSSVYRTAILSGSDDREKWFVIREHIVLEQAGSDTADHYVQAISFPSSTYRFFKLILDDKGLLPVNILRAGITTRHSINGRYLGVPFPALIQNDSTNRHSYITLQYRDHYRIDRLELILKGPALFKRHAIVYDNGSQDRRQLAETDLTPGNTTLSIPSVKTNSLTLEIANGDDKPLIVEAVRTAELDQYLLTYLQPGAGYGLMAGFAHAMAPDYDLRYFADSLGRDPHELGSGPLQPIVRSFAGRPAPTDHRAFMLWIILGVVLLLLTYLSLNMAKAITGKKQ